MDPTQSPAEKDTVSKRGEATLSLAQESFSQSSAALSAYTRSQIKFLILRNDFLSDLVKNQAKTDLDALLLLARTTPLAQKEGGFSWSRFLPKARSKNSSPLPLSQLRELKEVIRHVEHIPPRLGWYESAILDHQIEYQLAELGEEYINNALASLSACGSRSAATTLALTDPCTMDSALQLAKEYFKWPSNQPLATKLEMLLSSIEARGGQAPLFRDLRMVLSELPELPRLAEAARAAAIDSIAETISALPELHKRIASAVVKSLGIDNPLALLSAHSTDCFIEYIEARSSKKKGVTHSNYQTICETFEEMMRDYDTPPPNDSTIALCAECIGKARSHYSR